jgi:primosomal protein N' (replication factor Y)
MRVPAAFAPPKPLVVYAAGATRPEKITPARQKVFDALAARGAMTSAELARVAGVSGSVVKTLIKDRHLTAHELPGDITFDTPDAAHRQTSLSAEQGEVASALRAAVQAGDFSPHLLDGVTGAGKTEVYFEAIAQALEMGKKALVLLPEISLTTQFLDRFEARFGCAPALWHSGLSPAERRRTWRELAENRISVLVGARSALFLPWRDLGVIIVDEEHDGGFKQEDGVIYNARDMAVVRAQLAACAVVLSTATPSLETYVNARDGRYQAHRLTARHGAAQLPEIELVDMRAHQPPRGAWLVPQMVARVGAAIERGEQALLFLNRRGYAPLTLCRACGHRYACPDCDAWMVEHRFRKQLQCHHCGHVEAVPDSCQSCGETEEIIGHFPDARTVILSSDMGGVAAMRDAIERISAGEADIIVGTQIVAKGHHFPQLSFVGVVDADLGLGNGDLRAAERTYQLLSQVAGRSGRSVDVAGFAMLQSHMPEHPVLQALASGDRDGFFEREIMAREMAKMPPFGRLAALIVSATSPDEGMAFVRQLAAKIPALKGVQVLGPAPAPIARIRNRYRYRFLLKADRHAPLQGFIGDWLRHAKPRGSVRLSVDIDPYNFL